MTEHSYLIEFAKLYGVHEAVVLSELCKRKALLKTGDLSFYREDAESIFTYFSESQIRSVIESLIRSKCIQKTEERSGRNRFIRHIRYDINDEIFDYYNKIFERTMYNKFIESCKETGY